jgi:hypothetical protein
MKKKQQQHYFTAGNSSVVNANASQISLPSGPTTNIIVNTNGGAPLGGAALIS